MFHGLYYFTLVNYGLELKIHLWKLEYSSVLELNKPELQKLEQKETWNKH